MAITLMNPEGLPKVDILHQVSVATGSKTVFVAGRVAWDSDGNTVGEGDFAAQVEQCYLNIATALAKVGGSFDDVAKLTIYVPDWTIDKYPLLEEGIARASAKLGVAISPPGSLIGIGALHPRSHGRGRGHSGHRLSAKTMRRPAGRDADLLRRPTEGPFRPSNTSQRGDSHSSRGSVLPNSR